MSFRDGLPFDEAVRRQERLNRVGEEHAQANQLRTVEATIAQIKAGTETPATRVLVEWLTSQLAQSA